MNILVTGARAPVALEWAHRLNHCGARKVILADCLHYPLGRFYKKGTYRQFTSPVLDAYQFIHDIATIVQQENIHCIVPTCEEIFYLARHKAALPSACTLFAPAFPVLQHLHNKWDFIHTLHSKHARAPETFLLTTHEKVCAWQKRHTAKDFVFKPVYSRFGSEVHIAPKPYQSTCGSPSWLNATSAVKKYVHTA